MKNDRNIVFETHNPVEASIVQSILESNGIEVFVYKESLSNMFGFYSSAMGRISLGVHADEMEKAAEILEGYREQAGGESPES
jgi:hypothetical protein